MHPARDDDDDEGEGEPRRDDDMRGSAEGREGDSRAPAPFARERRQRSDVADEVWRKGRDREVRGLVAALPHAQREVLARRWGLLGEAFSVAQTAAALGLEPIEVQRLEASALATLRDAALARRADPGSWVGDD